MWEFLVAIQEELYASQARLLGFVLEAPFDLGFRSGHWSLLWGHIVRDWFGDI